MPPKRAHPFARHVEVGGVADVVAAALQEAGHVRLIAEHVAGAVIVDVGAIEADLDREAASEAELVVVERFAHPAVVGLVGGDARLEVEVAHPVVLDDQRNVGAVGERLVAQDADQVQAADGVRRDLDGERRRPVALDEARGRVGRAGRLRSRGRRSLDQLARARAAVPAQAVERPAHAHGTARRGGDVRHHLEALACLGRDPIRIGLDVHRPVGGARAGRSAVAADEGPAGVARQRVLRGDRVDVPRRAVLRIGAAGPAVDAAVGRLDAPALRARKERTDGCRRAPVSHGRKLGARPSARNPAWRPGFVKRRTKCGTPLPYRRSRIGHSYARAWARRRGSGFTAVGRPTTASIG